MRIIERTTRFALWARRLSFSAVVVLSSIIILRHVIGLKVGLLVLGLAVATLSALSALILAVLAYIRIWHTGDRGWRRATYAIIVSLIVMSPGFVAFVRSISYPQIFEVSSDLRAPVARLRPPGFVEPKRTQQSLGEVALARYFPLISPKIYPVEPRNMMEIVQTLVEANKWSVLDVRSEFADFGDGHIHAVARSTVFRFEDDIHIRVRPVADGVQVDMMSSARFGNHDLGANGRRIERFFGQLNARMATLPDSIKNTTP